MSFASWAGDLAIVGAGAAGLATAIFVKREVPSLRVALLDGSPRPGAKILVSGGGRCNVTNTIIRDRDFWGGKRTIIRRVLQALPVADTVSFFAELGVNLHEEAGGKLFPDTNRARDVLNALLRETEAAGARLLSGHRVTQVVRITRDAAAAAPNDANFRVVTERGEVLAASVVL